MWVMTKEGERTFCKGFSIEFEIESQRVDFSRNVLHALNLLLESDVTVWRELKHNVAALHTSIEFFQGVMSFDWT